MPSAQADISPPARAGHTLVELVVSLAVMSILLVAIASAIVLAGGAVPRSNDPGRPTDAAFSVVDQMTAELHFALSFNERSLSAVEFAVPDRDGDMAPEVIRYEWSRTPGDPVTRRYNGGPVVKVIESVVDFNLDYETQTAKRTVASTPLSAELLLASYASGSSLGAVHVSPTSWWGQYFKPALPANAIEWSVTRVRFRAAQGDTPLPTTVELREVEGDLTPSDTVLSSAILDPAELTPAFEWVEKLLPATNLDPDEGLALVFTTPTDRTAQLECQTDLVSQPDLGLSVGTPAWGPLQTNQSLLFEVYGTQEIATTKQKNVKFLTAVDIEVQSGGEESSEIESGTTLLHRPEVD